MDQRPPSRRDGSVGLFAPSAAPADRRTPLLATSGSGAGYPSQMPAGYPSQLSAGYPSQLPAGPPPAPPGSSGVGGPPPPPPASLGVQPSRAPPRVRPPTRARQGSDEADLRPSRASRRGRGRRRQAMVAPEEDLDADVSSDREFRPSVPAPAAARGAKWRRGRATREQVAGLSDSAGEEQGAVPASSSTAPVARERGPPARRPPPRHAFEVDDGKAPYPPVAVTSEVRSDLGHTRAPAPAVGSTVVVPPPPPPAQTRPLGSVQQPSAPPPGMVGATTDDVATTPAADANASAARAAAAAAAAAAESDEEEVEGGFWSRLAAGAKSAIGLVSDLVSAINADTDTEDETAAKSGEEADGDGKDDPATAANDEDADDAGLAFPRLKALSNLEDDPYVDYVTQFCVYLGLDVTAEPELISEVDAFLKRPVPDGWVVHQTSEDCEYGSGFSYYVHEASATTQWTRPDEDEFLRQLGDKAKRPPLAGSRLFFAALRDRTRKARSVALEEKVSHLPELRPLLRALPEGEDPDTWASPPGQQGIFHVALYDQFPVLSPASVEAFASYFGLGGGNVHAKLGVAELRQLWIAKLAALCPVPEGYLFCFDETSMGAVFVDSAANTASRHHPLDAFFAGLLERMLARHRTFEAAEAQKLGRPVSLGGKVGFFLDGAKGAPYWLRYDNAGEAPSRPWIGPLPAAMAVAGRAQRSHAATPSIPTPPWQQPQPVSRPTQPRPEQAATPVGSMPPLPQLPKQGDGVKNICLPKQMATGPDSMPPLPQLPKQGDVVKKIGAARAAASSGSAAVPPPMFGSQNSHDDLLRRLAGEADVPRPGDTAVACSTGPPSPSTEHPPRPPDPAIFAPTPPPAVETDRRDAKLGAAFANAAPTPAGDSARDDMDRSIMSYTTVDSSVLQEERSPAAKPFQAASLEMGESVTVTFVERPFGMTNSKDEGVGGYVVGKIAPGKPAAQVGVDVGWRVVAVAGRPCAELAADTIQMLLKGADLPVEVVFAKPTDSSEVGPRTAAVAAVSSPVALETVATPLASQGLSSLPPLPQVRSAAVPSAAAPPPPPPLGSGAPLFHAAGNKLASLPEPAQQSAMGPAPPPPQIGAPLFQYHGGAAVPQPHQAGASCDGPPPTDSPPQELSWTSVVEVVCPESAAPEAPARDAVAEAICPESAAHASEVAAADRMAACAAAVPSVAAATPPQQPPPQHRPPALPVLPNRDSGDEGLQHWEVKDGKWFRGSRLSSDEGSGAEVFGDQRKRGSLKTVKRVGTGVKATIAKLAAATGAESDVAEGVTAVGFDQHGPGVSGAMTHPQAQVPGQHAPPPSPPPSRMPTAGVALAPEEALRLAELMLLAERLRAIPPDDLDSICKVLEELEQVPATVNLLRETQLGVLTQAYKDHADRRVRTVARRLRRGWKDLISTSAAQATADHEARRANAARLVEEPMHQMMPPSDAGDGADGSSRSSGSGVLLDSSSLGTASVANAQAGSVALPALPSLGLGQSGQAGSSQMQQRVVAKAAASAPSAEHAAAKRKRVEMVMNLQWLCRLYLETRETLFAAHQGKPTEEFVCAGLREEQDVVRFKSLLEKSFAAPAGRGPPRALVRLLRGFCRRALNVHVHTLLGSQAFIQFEEACAGTADGRSFASTAVPRLLKLLTKLIDEGKAGAAVAADAAPGAAAAPDLWLDSGREEDDDWHGATTDTAFGHSSPKGKPAAQPVDASVLQAATNSTPAQPFTGGQSAAAVGQSSTDYSRAHDARKLPAASPAYSGDPALMVRVAKAPLPDLDGLVSALVPGAEIATEGVLTQLADEELVMFAYALEQIELATNSRIVKELEVRDELRSVCMHRREYLALLDGSLGL